LELYPGQPCLGRFLKEKRLLRRVCFFSTSN